MELVVSTERLASGTAANEEAEQSRRQGSDSSSEREVTRCGCAVTSPASTGSYTTQQQQQQQQHTITSELKLCINENVASTLKKNITASNETCHHHNSRHSSLNTITSDLNVSIDQGGDCIQNTSVTAESSCNISYKNNNNNNYISIFNISDSSPKEESKHSVTSAGPSVKSNVCTSRSDQQQVTNVRVFRTNDNTATSVGGDTSDNVYSATLNCSDSESRDPSETPQDDSNLHINQLNSKTGSIPNKYSTVSEPVNYSEDKCDNTRHTDVSTQTIEFKNNNLSHFELDKGIELNKVTPLHLGSDNTSVDRSSSAPEGKSGTSASACQCPGRESEASAPPVEREEAQEVTVKLGYSNTASGLGSHAKPSSFTWSQSAGGSQQESSPQQVGHPARTDNTDTPCPSLHSNEINSQTSTVKLTSEPAINLTKALTKLTTENYDFDSLDYYENDASECPTIGGGGSGVDSWQVVDEEPSIGNSGSRIISTDDEDCSSKDHKSDSVLIERNLSDLYHHEDHHFDDSNVTQQIYLSEDNYYDISDQIEYVRVLNNVACFQNQNNTNITTREMRQKNKGGSNKEENDSGTTVNGGSNTGTTQGGTEQNGHGNIHPASARSILKSVLKRTGSKKVSKSNSSKKKHRVQFNESLNKFFEADYVILIREEEYEGECDNDEVCTCNSEREMVRIGKDEDQEGEEEEEEDDEEEDPDNPGNSTRSFDLNIPETCTFEPPLEFIDQVTLSPPEGYKDVVNQQQHQLLLQQQQMRNIARGAAAAAVSKGLGVSPPQQNEHIGEESESESSLEARSEDDEGDGEGGLPVAPVTTDIPVILTGEQHEVQDPSKFPQQRYIVETITMTTVTERRIVREADDHIQRRSSSSGFNTSAAESDVKLSGILKGGKLWKSTDSPNGGPKTFIEETSTSFSTPAASSPVKDDEIDGGPGAGRRSVRFSEETPLTPDSPGPELAIADTEDDKQEECKDEHDGSESVKEGTVLNEDASSPDSTELTLTFKLGNHVLVSNSLRPNSAVRQLFPAPRFLSPPPLTNRSITDEATTDEGNYENNPESTEESGEMGQNRDSINTDNPTQQFIVTAESLRLFEEAKRSKLAQLYNNKEESQQDGNQEAYIAVMSPIPLITSPGGGNAGSGNSDDDDSTSTQIRRTIERNALRRSLLRYEPGRNKRNLPVTAKPRSEDSLVERIRKLTCDLDEEDEEGGGRNDDHEGENTQKRGVDASTDTDTEMDFDSGGTVMPPRSSPPGEEAKKQGQSNKFIASPNTEYGTNRFIEKTSSPSSGSSSSSVSSGSASSTYKKLTDLFARRNTENKIPVSADGLSPCPHDGSKSQPPTSIEWNTAPYYSTECTQHQYISPPDLGNGLPIHVTPPRDFANGDNKGTFVGPKCAVSRMSVTAEARKQFLSTLAPLAACVSAGNTGDEEIPGDNNTEYYQISVASPSNLPAGDRASIASTSTLAGGEESEYSLDDIDEVLKEEQKAPQPDVVAGTQIQSPGAAPTSNGDGLAGTVDELALFVQQDAGRIERIKKRYSVNSNTPSASDDDDHDDYGFNRRPSVRGIKPRFGSTTEILQQMQTQLQPPMLACASRTGSHMTWPYCSPEGTPVTGEPPNIRRRGILQARCPAAMPVLQEETAYPYDYSRGISYGVDYNNGIVAHQESPTESIRKDAMGRRYVTPNQIMYASTGNLYQTPQQIMRIGGGCAENQMYGTLSNRPMHHSAHLQHPPASSSPPPPGVPRNYPQSFSNSSSPVQQIIALPPSDPTGIVPYHHQYQGDPRFASIQSLDRATGTIYGRRVVPPGMVQMRVSPVSSGPPPPQQSHYATPVASASVRLSAPFIDPNITAVIEPHYSTLPHPNASSRSSPVPPTSIIRVGQGQQQTIRVPYPSGTPVQVHLLTRTGVGGPRSESPQRGLGSPSGQPSSTPPGGQYPSPQQQQQQQQYVVARGTQTASNTLYQIPANARYYPPQAPVGNANNGPIYSKGGMPYPDPVKPQLNYVQQHQHQPRRATSPLPYQNISSSSSSTSSSSPTRSKYVGGAERGVPEGAASSSPSFPQDSMYHLPLSSTAPSLQPTSQTLAQSPISTPTSTTSVYYAMNV